MKQERGLGGVPLLCSWCGGAHRRSTLVVMPVRQVCSTTDGEDPTCSDSLPLPISVDDHLDYLNYKISDSC